MISHQGSRVDLCKPGWLVMNKSRPAVIYRANIALRGKIVTVESNGRFFSENESIPIDSRGMNRGIDSNCESARIEPYQVPVDLLTVTPNYSMLIKDSVNKHGGS